MTDWNRTNLGELFKFRAGTGFPKHLQGETRGSLPFAKVSDMNRAGNVVTLSFAENYITEGQATNLRAYVHKAGSIAFAKIGVALTTNRRRQITRPIVLDNNMMSAEPIKEAIDSKYSYYLLSTMDFNEVSAGSAIPYLTVGSLKEISVSIPALEEQREIAAILGALDDKIELNRKTAATLEAMARALYRSWFVDFDPVHAKAAGRAPAHMDAATAALFPDSFGDDGLPEGWSLSTIGEVGEVAGGATPKTKEPLFWEAGHHLWATPKDLSSLSQPVLFETERKVTDLAHVVIKQGRAVSDTSCAPECPASAPGAGHSAGSVLLKSLLAYGWKSSPDVGGHKMHPHDHTRLFLGLRKRRDAPLRLHPHKRLAIPTPQGLVLENTEQRIGRIAKRPIRPPYIVVFHGRRSSNRSSHNQVCWPACLSATLKLQSCSAKRFQSECGRSQQI